MDISIREARLDDAEQIAAAHVEGWRVGYRGLVPDEYLDSPAFATARREGWQQLLSGGRPEAVAPDDQVLVPVVAGQVVGFGHIGSERVQDSRAAGRGELHGFYLHPDHWGQGIADRLIERCHEELDQRWGEAMLWVLRDNPRARRFYERNGWSCGEGDHVIESEWGGPQIEGAALLSAPLSEIQYRRRAQ